MVELLERFCCLPFPLWQGPSPHSTGLVLVLSLVDLSFFGQDAAVMEAHGGSLGEDVFRPVEAVHQVLKFFGVFGYLAAALPHYFNMVSHLPISQGVSEHHSSAVMKRF